MIFTSCVHVCTAFGPTLRQCMQRQNLTRFLELYDQVKEMCSYLNTPLNVKGAICTIFAPNNSAFDAIDIDSLTNEQICQLLRNHVVNKRLDGVDLTHSQRIVSMAFNTLYANTVLYYAPVDEILMTEATTRVCCTLHCFVHNNYMPLFFS